MFLWQAEGETITVSLKEYMSQDGRWNERPDSSRWMGMHNPVLGFIHCCLLPRAQLQNPRNNYITIYTNMSSYFPGDKVPVTVRSTRDFMGFLLQARRVSNDQIAGTFVAIPPGSKLLMCFEDGDTVTHSDKSLKRNLSFVWKAPDHPIGDIKFFLSIVQSYFVYWARIESAIMRHQIQNQTTSNSSKEASIITPTLLQKPTDPQIADTEDKGSSSLQAVTSFTLYAKFVPGRVTGMAVTKILETVFGDEQDTELLGNDRQLSEPPMESAALSVSHSHGGKQGNRSNTFEVQGLEPSLELQELDMANALRSLILQDYTSSHITHDGTQSISSAATAQPCLTCEEDVQEDPGNLAITQPVLHITAPLSPWSWTTESVAVTGSMSQPKDDLDTSSSLSSASRQIVERKSVAQETLANFLPHSEDAESREEDDDIGEIPRNPLPLVTRPVPKAAVPGKGEHPTRGTQLVAAQLGILLGCTAALGMALAAGLRCIHSQYCHKRTEVSFSEPDNNVITGMHPVSKTGWQKEACALIQSCHSSAKCFALRPLMEEQQKRQMFISTEESLQGAVLGCSITS
ncbi:hypothetical protein Y1Q_0021864 [Alligator mississippiensis]|uniref:Reelin domain-containing protein n=1 Tax=Alligator mississippiensis TaxID=8496 RepID=A0A151PBE7_ALLMI|nr:hypothetical protein Y1Q_0021864 [Alligator mississippiensis]